MKLALVRELLLSYSLEFFIKLFCVLSINKIPNGSLHNVH